MTAREALQSLVGRTYRDEEGEESTIALLPPCTDEQIEAFAARQPCPLPAEIRELLALARGFEGGPVEQVDFLGDERFPRGAFEHPIAFSPDGLGNSWVISLAPDSEAWGPVYFWCHDPPVLVYQCANLTEYLLAVGRQCDSPEDNPLDQVSRVDTLRIWKENPGLIPQPEALASEDSVLRDFAESLEPDWLICDLRNPRPGDGFAFGRKGIADGCRDGDHPMFAYRLKPKKRGAS